MNRLCQPDRLQQRGFPLHLATELPSQGSGHAAPATYLSQDMLCGPCKPAGSTSPSCQARPWQGLLEAHGPTTADMGAEEGLHAVTAHSITSAAMPQTTCSTTAFPCFNIMCVSTAAVRLQPPGSPTWTGTEPTLGWQLPSEVTKAEA